MNMKKILSLILFCSLLLSILVSCEKTPEGLIERAEKKLSKNEYIIEVEIDYATDNKDVAGIFGQLSKTEIEVLVDGDRASIRNSLVLDIDGEINEFENSCIIIGSDVYMDMIYRIGAYTETNKGKAKLYEGDREELLDKGTLIGSIEMEDFESSELRRYEDEYIIVCTGTDSALEEKLCKILLSQLEDAADTVSVKDAQLTITVENGRYDTKELVCKYEVELSDNTYTVTADIELEYDYDERIDISSPAFSEEYPDLALDIIKNML